MVLLLSVLFLANLSAPKFYRILVESVKPNHEQEIAVEGRLPFRGSISIETFKACVPQESFDFPDSLSKELSSRIFDEKELTDLSGLLDSTRTRGVVDELRR